MSKFGSPEQDRMRAANMAFLNTDDSMMALRAKEAVLGGIQAGGQYYQLNEGRDALISGEDGKPIAANPDKKRAFMSGNHVCYRIPRQFQRSSKSSSCRC